MTSISRASLQSTLGEVESWLRQAAALLGRRTQTIARARRMGQLETVQVHRLLFEDGVDARLRQMLAVKAELFRDFARESDVAEAAPEAMDVSEAELAREVIAVERERLRSTP